MIQGTSKGKTYRRATSLAASRTEVERDYGLAFQLIARVLGNAVDLAERHGIGPDGCAALEGDMKRARHELAEALRNEPTPAPSPTNEVHDGRRRHNGRTTALAGAVVEGS